MFFYYLAEKKSKKNPQQINVEDLKEGDDLLSHNAVPSALMGLTSLFGMVRGGPLRNSHQKKILTN